MSQFENLVTQAKSSNEPQRILFLFAKATNMFDPKETSYKSGTIDAVMCVDKSPNELSTFKALAGEADQQTKNWNFVFTSSIVGVNNQEPTDNEIDEALKRMSNMFANGDDLSQFIVWDREEKLVVIS